MAIPISGKDHIRKETSKANRLQAHDKLNELIDHLTLLNQHEHMNNLEMEGKDIMAKKKNSTSSKVHKNRSSLRNKKSSHDHSTV